jgi:methylated-DNA-[protein]-cysteine S-methyltransferase
MRQYIFGNLWIKRGDLAMIYYNWMESPLGRLLLTSNGGLLTGIYMEGQKYFPQNTEAWHESAQIDPLIQTQQQLGEYFAYQRQSFNIPINPQGTTFQKQVWQLLLQIPFGETISYGKLAQMFGKATAYRAVGAANGKNPISIVVPCHRVVATNGNLTGYAGGLDRKQWLLKHEKANESGYHALPTSRNNPILWS